MKKLYNKLVRDRIPDIITASGKSCNTAILDADDYVRMLDEKLNEEVAEYQESKSMEELADILEVIDALAAARGHSLDEVMQIKARKAEERGGFKNRVLLKAVYSQE